LKTLLAPFLDTRHASAGKLALWTTLLLGGPLALLVALLVSQKLDRPTWKLRPSRETAISIAAEQATRLGLSVRGWGVVANPEVDSNWDVVFGPKVGTRPGRPAIAVPARLLVTFFRPDQRVWLRVTLDPEGRVVGYRCGGPDLTAVLKAASQTAPADPAQLASEALKSQQQRLAGLDLQPAEEQRFDAGLGVTGRRFVWHARASGFPDADFEITADVVGNAVVRFETGIAYSRQILDRDSLARNASQLGNLARVIAAIGLVGFACFLYAKRSREKEAPHGRAAILAGALAVFSVLLVVLEPGLGMIGQKVEDFSTVPLLSAMIAVLFTLLVQGLLLGLAYGSSEGTVRERYSGKLTSLDALLTGRFFNQPVGVAVLTGAAVAAWAASASFLLQTRFPGLLCDLTGRIGMLTYLNRAQFVLAVNLPLVAMMSTVMALLLPLTIYTHTASWRRMPRWLAAAICLAAALIVVNIGVGVDFGVSAWYLNTVLDLSVLACAFWLGDLLSAIMAISVFSTLSGFHDAERLVSSWEHATVFTVVIGSALLLPLVLGAWFGRKLTDEEVRPGYAHNLFQRLALEAEFLAAGEAQRRLLPAVTPKIAGLSLAGACIPAPNVSGDFYDLVRTHDGQLLLMAAEGGNDGLVSALTIALAKGFLLFESDAPRSPREIVEAMHAALGNYFVRASGRTSILVAKVSPDSGMVHAARTGEYPRMLVLTDAGEVWRPKLEFASPRSDIQLLNFEVQPADTLLVFTDGLPRELQAATGKDVIAWLRGAASFRGVPDADRLCQALVQAARGREGTRQGDDITALVVRRLAENAGASEAVA